MTESGIATARLRILDGIAEAAARVGRDPAGIEVVAVTKTVAPERIQEAITAGFRTFAENRVQERQSKAADLLAGSDAEAVGAGAPPADRESAPAPVWHLIGPLQSNKARRAVELFDVIQTVDSLDLAARLGRIAGEVRPGRALPVLLQVNVDADAAKSGFEPAALERDLPAILDIAGLLVRGLMAVGRLVGDAEDARPTFVVLRRLSDRLRERHSGLGPGLSMGMSHDYLVAVEEGATLVRIGSAIFGARPTVR